ncbi:MAG: recombinase family protein, partial [Frankiaceae bacterium]|nr:recombinase family protein [Frankiaceae bacterium]
VPTPELPDALERCRAVLAVPAGRAPRRVRANLPQLQGPLLQRIAELHGAGGSLHTIAAALNAEDRLHPSGRRWHSSTVAKVVAGLPRQR